MSKFAVGDYVYHTAEPEEVAVVVAVESDKWVTVAWKDGEDSHPEANLELDTSYQANNAVSPNVYKFPKAEVRDISAHLTSYGGQVVQYVARSTRLDGIFKDDRVQDLEKAKLMIQWEIDRLQETK